MQEWRIVKGLIIGRFQPFHNGHLKVISKISKECDLIIVGVGSAQDSHTPENPFTAGERYVMISRALDSEGISDYYIVPIVDVNRNALWVAHVESLLPPFDVVFTNNPLPKQLFKERGYKVKGIKLYDRKRYSSTEIRKRMIAGKTWTDLVPKEVAKTIKEIDGVSRLKQLAKDDL